MSEQIIDLKLLEYGLTKKAILNMAVETIENCLENGTELQVAEALKAMEIFIKKVRENKHFVDAVRNELTKWKGEYKSSSGAVIEKMEAGYVYDYDVCGDWELGFLEHRLMATKNDLEARKEFLKNIPSAGLDVITPDGEPVKIYPPNRTSTSTFKVTLK